MTDAEWTHCADVGAMLECLHNNGKLSDRVIRLFAAACCRQAWHLFPDGGCSRAVVVAEWDVDGLTNREAVAVAARGVGPPGGRGPVDILAAGGAAWAALSGGRELPRTGGRTTPIDLDAITRAINLLVFASPKPEQERRSQAGLLRDIVGPVPFRAIQVDPSWLAWNGGTIPRLALAAYEDRCLPTGNLDSTRLAILADALEDAGLDDPAILAHLREPGPHVRGCFAVDAILGRQ